MTTTTVTVDLSPLPMTPIPELPQILSGREAYGRLYADALRQLYDQDTYHLFTTMAEGSWPAAEILQKHTIFGPRPITDMWAATNTHRARTVRYAVETRIGIPMTETLMTEVTNIERSNALRKVKYQIESTAAARLITLPSPGYTNTGDILFNGTAATNVTAANNDWSITTSATTGASNLGEYYYYRPSVSIDDLTITNESVTINVDGLSQIRYLVEGTLPDDVILNIDANGNLNVAIAAVNIKNSIRAKIRSNLVIKMGKKKNTARTMLPQKIPAQELKARETLREMISESDYRRYLTNGFIMVKAPSGLWYQVFGNGNRVKTYKNGKPFENLCIHTDQSCPPSDHVINMKVLIEIDEDAIRKGSNISSATPLNDSGGLAYTRAWVPNNPNMSLVDTFKAMKVA